MCVHPRCLLKIDPGMTAGGAGAARPGVQEGQHPEPHRCDQVPEQHQGVHARILSKTSASGMSGQSNMRATSYQSAAHCWASHNPMVCGRVQVEAVREELARMKARDPGAKAIVFSQFTSMLDILHFRLTQARCN